MDITIIEASYWFRESDLDPFSGVFFADLDGFPYLESHAFFCAQLIHLASWNDDTWPCWRAQFPLAFNVLFYGQSWFIMVSHD